MPRFTTASHRRRVTDRTRVRARRAEQHLGARRERERRRCLRRHGLVERLERAREVARRLALGRALLRGARRLKVVAASRDRLDRLGLARDAPLVVRRVVVVVVLFLLVRVRVAVVIRLRVRVRVAVAVVVRLVLLGVAAAAAARAVLVRVAVIAVAVRGCGRVRVAVAVIVRLGRAGRRRDLERRAEFRAQRLAHEFVLVATEHPGLDLKKPTKPVKRTGGLIVRVGRDRDLIRRGRRHTPGHRITSRRLQNACRSSM